jgi:hypothetical protein
MGAFVHAPHEPMSVVGPPSFFVALVWERVSIAIAVNLRRAIRLVKLLPESLV